MIAFACTASGFVEGVDGEIELRARMCGAGRPSETVTTSGAVAGALQSLGLRRIVVTTPYPDELNVLEKQFLEDEGIEVLSISGMGIVDAFSIGKVTPQETYAFARRVWQDAADGMFISCTNLPTLGVLARLEAGHLQQLGYLRALGCREAIGGYGRLLAEQRDI